MQWLWIISDFIIIHSVEQDDSISTTVCNSFFQLFLHSFKWQYQESHSPLETQISGLLCSDFIMALMKTVWELSLRRRSTSCCNTYKVPNSTSLLMNSSSILVSTMGFSKAPRTSCPKIKSIKKKLWEWNSEGLSCPLFYTNENQIHPILCATCGFIPSRRRDIGKWRVNEGVQGKVKMTEQHQANTHSCMDLRLRGIPTARGWRAPACHWNRQVWISHHPVTLGSEQVTEANPRHCLTLLALVLWVSCWNSLKIHHPALEESTNKALETFDWWLPFILPERTAHWHVKRIKERKGSVLCPLLLGNPRL